MVTPSAPQCSWSASTVTPWITLPSKTSTVQSYTVSANATGSPRNGSIAIAGQTVSVNQAGVCTYDISPASQTFGAGGGSLSVNVTAPSGCPWAAVSNASWITVAPGAPGSGTGFVTLQAAANVGGLRSGTVTIAGKTFNASQSAAGCGTTDVSSQVTVTRGAIASNFTRSTYVEQVRLTTQGATVAGPVYLVLDGLPATAAPCVGGTCSVTPTPPLTFCQSLTGSSLIIAAPSGLTPGQVVTLSIQFLPGAAQGGVPPTWYTTRIFSGTPTQ